MEFFLDVDGVILDFEKSMVDFVRANYLPDLPADYVPKSWEMTDEFTSLDIVEVWNDFIDSDRFTRLDLLIDAESFNRISSEHSVYLVTNLPPAQYESRQKNLALHRLNYTDMILAGHFNFNDDSYPTKSEAIRSLHRNGERLIFLDDHPQNCRDVKSAFKQSEVFLMNRPHNLGVEGEEWVRVANWGEFLERVF